MHRTELRTKGWIFQCQRHFSGHSSIWFHSYFQDKDQSVLWGSWRKFYQFVLFNSTYYCMFLFQAHIFDLLRSKLTSFKNFHTLLYTCSPEFDFLPISTINELNETCLLPTVGAVIVILLHRWGRNFVNWKRKSLERDKIFEPDVVYNVLQLAAFTIMAVFIMRLKLFWSPHLCLLTSLIMSPKVIYLISEAKELSFNYNIKQSQWGLIFLSLLLKN